MYTLLWRDPYIVLLLHCSLCVVKVACLQWLPMPCVHLTQACPTLNVLHSSQERMMTSLFFHGPDVLFLVHAKDSAFTTGEYEVTRSSSSAVKKQWCHHVLLFQYSGINGVTLTEPHCSQIYCTWPNVWYIVICTSWSNQIAWVASEIFIIVEHSI